jgi:hypothetical protein
MPLPILALPVALHLVVAASSGVPTFDIRPSCQAAAAEETAISDRMQACVSTEQDAHNQLVKNWTTYQVVDRSRCVGMMTEFDPSYTELLTCLDMANQVRKLPAELY